MGLHSDQASDSTRLRLVSPGSAAGRPQARLITGMHLNPKRDGHGRRGDDSARPLPRRRAA